MSDKEGFVNTFRLWKVVGWALNPLGDPLKDLFIVAESLDEAISLARKINEGYCGGQVVT